ncbi:MAG: TraB/GumN family protein [Deltaproteobacteria bacterium]|nr:TraB/GumN family protein [Deltaproteobacteria bacterium]
MPSDLIKIGEKEIVLIGTAHVSKTSVEEVREAIETRRPEVVAIELCKNRYDVLKNPKAWQQTDIIKVIREKKASFLFANLVMASFQRRIGEKFGIKPGQEMKVAIEVAEKLGVPVALIDRPIQTTLQRAWRNLTFIERIKLIWTSLISIFAVDDLEEDTIEKLKEKDVLSAAVDEIARAAPTIKKVLIDERDTYMANKIAELEENKILAVIGAGHMQGIKEQLASPASDNRELEDVPAKKRGFWKWLIPLAIFFFVLAGFFFGGPKQGYEVLKWWLVCNAVFAALGAMVALAHPITILVAGLASPITSLNPTLAAGWFAGLSEAYLKKPTVADFESVQDDISSIKGFWKNPITRILMVVVFANLGSAIGAIVAMPILTRIIISG